MAALRPAYPLFLSCLLVAASFCTPAALAKKKNEVRTTVADLRYGVALYHYYQEEYLDALTELLVAKERGGIQGHGDNPEIMEGGFALAWGLEQHAGDIFDRLLENNRSVEARDAAWFFIARLRYHQQDYAGVDEAISHISKKPARKVSEELTVLKINQAIKQNRLDEAEQLMHDEEIADAWVPYVVYNMASAFARAGRFSEALGYYKFFREEELSKKEHIALYDKALTGAGYSYLFDKQPQQAMEQFSYVRRDSPHATRALLGYGWAAVELDDYKTALKPWTFLAKSSLVDENSLEALVAVPYAYEKLGAENLALENFKAAEARFVEEIFTLGEVIANLEGDSILEALQIEKSEGLNWLRYAEENQLAPQISYLIRLFSTEQFQSTVQELRDLLAAQAMLYSWQEKLVFYSDMLDEREFSRSTKNQFMAQTELREKIDNLQIERSTLASEIERVTGSRDYLALLNEEQKDLLERIQRSERTIKAMGDSDPFIDDYREAARRYRGLMLWDASESYSPRTWEAIKRLNQLDQTIADIKLHHRSILDILANAPDMNAYRQRISVANGKLSVQIRQTDAAVEKAKNQLRDQVSGVLVAQQNRLNHYLSQSRLSIARIYDKARFEYQQKEAEAFQRAHEAAEQEELQNSEQAADPQSVQSQNVQPQNFHSQNKEAPAAAENSETQTPESETQNEEASE